ncbi:MAG: phosphatidylglycerophosphatase A, partial [Phycisphaerales bacterium]|nr:phosphatidylglycerophosphatase A [Phycisphaerales bacterium]
MTLAPKSRAPLIPPGEAMRKMGTIRGLLVTAGGLGFIQPAGGTWGSMPPVAIAFLLAILAVPEFELNLVVVLVGLVGVVSCLRFGGLAEEVYGQKDPNPVVADEIAGQSVAIFLLPWQMGMADGAFWWNVGIAASAFLAFRFFDIFKLPPASSVEHLKGGVGIL